MATLVYRNTELRDLSVRRCWFSIEAGWRDGLVVRGEDIVIPGKSGRDQESKVADYRVIHLHGLVLGTSETNWDAVCTTLETTFAVDGASADLVVTSPYKGLASGTRTISARVERVDPTVVIPMLVTEYNVILHAYGSPPDWADAPGGS